MNVDQINRQLENGNIEIAGLFPHLDELRESKYIFLPQIGLEALPLEPGLIAIRGARQYGKSTWLEAALKRTVREFGAGSAFYLNGDEIESHQELTQSIRSIIALYRRDATVRRLFIDEITAIPEWEKSLKRLIDAGELRQVLLVTTGSKATDLRRGTERLPGRKGKLDRSSYLFLPISYQEFSRVCGAELGPKTLLSYLISGGSPIACREIAEKGRIPEYVVTLTRDWILGEFASSGRSRASVLKILELIHRFGGTPVGYSKLAREADLANNTVASGYIELLEDMLCLIPGFAWETSRKVSLLRKPCKFHFINLLVATVWSPSAIRTVADFEALPEAEQGKWFEWLVAQELWRREALASPEPPLSLDYWQSQTQEIDFVLSKGKHLFEVKRGFTRASDFAALTASFSRDSEINVVSQSTFQTDFINGVSFEDFMSGRA